MDGRWHTTRFSVEPSDAFLVKADLGVSGSTRVVLMFLSRGILPTFMQFGSVLQGSGGLVYFCTDVLGKGLATSVCAWEK